MSLEFGAPVRFIQTHTVALPLDPHGALRALHERIKMSGLPLGRSRHAFTPHVTLSLYRTPDREELRELLAVRVTEPVVVDRIAVSLTVEPYPPKPLFDLPLGS
jgi:2'-5' RNA ligase